MSLPIVFTLSVRSLPLVLLPPCFGLRSQTICGAASNWYFTPIGQDGTKARGDGEGMLSDSAVSDSLWRTVRYHLGTVSFASLIIAVIQFIRAVILYFEEKAKNTMNDTMRCIIFGCLSCFMKCVECCMNQINRNGLVFVSVYGTAFCSSTCSAFSVALANAGRVAWVTMCGDFLMGIGKVISGRFCTLVLHLRRCLLK